MGNSVPVDLTRIDEVGSRFEGAWARGDRPRIEEFLAGATGPLRSALLRHLIEVEVELRRGQGEAPSQGEYTRRFPDDSEVVRAALPGADSRASRSGPSPVPSTTLTPPEPPGPDLTVSYVHAGADGTFATRARGAGDGRLVGFAPGMVLAGRYRLESEIGRGAMGKVFLGRDLRLSRPVAIKAILPGRHARSPGEQAQLEELFADEARIGANLDHPAVATVHDFGVHEGLPFTVFEYVPGESLQDLLKRRGRLPLDEVQLFLAPVSQGLDSAHARHVVHRDLKPANLRVTPQGQLKILDLGLAKEFDLDADWHFAGTPAYASPEQAAARACDGRADQYALAVIAFEMLTGRRPFVGGQARTVLLRHRDEVPPHPRTLMPDLPEGVGEALMRALSKDPNRRFGSCEEFARAMGCRFVATGGAAPEILLEAECRPRTRALRLLDDRNHLALTPEALWSNHAGEVREWPLVAVRSFQVGRGGRALRLRVRTAGDGSWSEEFRFRRKEECRHWDEQLRGLVAKGKGDSGGRVVDPEGRSVVLLRRHPDVRYQVLGRLEVERPRRRDAEGLMQIRAAMAGADAVIDVQIERRPLFDRTVRRLSGVAVRVLDTPGRLELRSRWFGEEAERIGGRMVGVALFYFILTMLFSFRLLTAPRGQVINSLATIGVVFGWLFGMAFAFRLLRWPQLAHPAALTFAGYGVSQFVGTFVGLVVGLAAGPFVGTRLQALGLVGILLANPAVLVLILMHLSVLRYQLLLARRAWQASDSYRRAFPGAPPPPAAIRSVTARVATVVAGALTVAITFGSLCALFVLVHLGPAFLDV